MGRSVYCGAPPPMESTAPTQLHFEDGGPEGDDFENDVFGFGCDLGESAYIEPTPSPPPAAVAAVVAGPAAEKRDAAEQAHAAPVGKRFRGPAAGPVGAAGPSDFVPASLEGVEERLRLAGELPRFVVATPGCLQHACVQRQAFVQFWPSHEWRVTGAQAESVEAWFLSSPPSVVPCVTPAGHGQRTRRGSKRKTPHTLPQPLTLQSHELQSPAVGVADATGGLEPRAVRVRTLSEAARALPVPFHGDPPVPSPAPLAGGPRNEGTLNASDPDGASQPFLAPGGGKGVRVPRTHPELAVISGVAGTGTEGSVAAAVLHTQPSAGLGAPAAAGMHD